MWSWGIPHNILTLIMRFRVPPILVQLQGSPNWPNYDQGPTGSCFQLRDGSGSGIGKNFGFGFGYGSGSGISTAFLSIGYYRVLKILIGYFPDKVLSFGSTKVLAALEPLDPSTRLARIYVGFNAILGCCSRRAEQIKEAAQKSD